MYDTLPPLLDTSDHSHLADPTTQSKILALPIFDTASEEAKQAASGNLLIIEIPVIHDGVEASKVTVRQLSKTLFAMNELPQYSHVKFIKVSKGYRTVEFMCK